MEGRIDGLKAAEYFVRRQLWLLVFGLFNAYILLWYWDVLFHYALLGMILFAFRSVSARRLVVAATVCLLLATARENIPMHKDHQVILRGLKAEAMDTTQVKRSPAQLAAMTAMQGIRSRAERKNKLARIEKNIQQVQGAYGDVYEVHSEKSYELETMGMFYFFIWDGLLFMLLGMAFLKNGWLLGKGPNMVYWTLFLIGLGAGIPLSCVRLQPMLEHGFNYFEVARQGGFLFY
jgi:uncharacterized protein